MPDAVGQIIECDCADMSTPTSTAFSLTIGTLGDLANPDPYPTKTYRFSIDPAKAAQKIGPFKFKLAVPMVQRGQSYTEYWLVTINYDGTLANEVEPQIVPNQLPTDTPRDQFKLNVCFKGEEQDPYDAIVSKNDTTRTASFGKFEIVLVRHFN